MDAFSTPTLGTVGANMSPTYGDSIEEAPFEDQDVVLVSSSSSSWASSSQQKRKRDKNVSSKNPTGSSNCHDVKIFVPLHSSDGNAEDYGYIIDSDDDEDALMDVGEYLYDDDDDDAIASTSNLAAQFDDMRLPPGVEVTVPWLQKPENDSKKIVEDVELKSHSEFKQINAVQDLSDHHYAQKKSKRLTHIFQKPSKKIVKDVEALKCYSEFKQFDTVQDFSDHYYVQQKSMSGGTYEVQKPPKEWAKRIQYEWKILESDLPESIYVRTCELRMDLLRAVIIGPAGTPYHDGLFFFDVLFPATYPNRPPLVSYHSGGLRLNPNLYHCGKVCLSLLGTWGGNGCEKWNPGKSTILQVLVSIQGLVLNSKPYFNEPCYATSVGSIQGELKSVAYNEEVFLLSCKTMMYSIRRPPKNFECFVSGHFCKRGRHILAACKAYMNGAQVGCVDEKGIQDVDLGDKGCSSTFKNSLRVIYEELLMEFTVKGADCDEFLEEKAKGGLANSPDATALKPSG